MSNVSEWSTTAASNNSAPPDGAPEGMLAGKVNDCIRELMSAMAKVYQDQRGSLSSTGSSNAYVLTTNNSHAALSDLPMLMFDANFENTGSATLNVDTLGAKTIYKAGGLQPLEAGDIKSGQMVVVMYNPTDDHFEMLNNTARSGVGKGHLWGLTMSLDTDDDHDWNVAAGEAADDQNEDLMVLASEITKQLDGNWSVGDDAGGLDTGTVAADTSYHIFLIKRSDTGVVDVLFSASATSPTMPSNYDRKRRIGSFLTDGDANVRGFYQYGDIFKYVQKGEADVISAEQVYALQTVDVPAVAGISPILDIYIDQDEGVATILFGSADDTTGANVTRIGTTGANFYVLPPGLVFTNSAGQIYVDTDDEGIFDGVVSYAMGWLDRRGKDA